MTRVEGMVLFPGAGSGRDQPGLVAIDVAATVPVWRVDFGYRRTGRKAPPRAPLLVEEVRQAVATTGLDPARLVLGGRSMGGRMASMAVAEGLPAAGLVLIAYPLHPPGRPEKARTAHLPDIDIPCLFASGTRDAFATPEELTTATATIAGSVTHYWVEGGRHDLKGADGRVAAAVASWSSTLG